MIIRQFKTLALVFVMGLSPVTAAWAAVDAAGAEKLKAYVQKSLDSEISLLKLQGAAVKATGELKVEPKDTYYAVSLPDLGFHDEKGNELVDLGVVTMNVMPGPKDGQWKMAMALPSPIRLISPVKKETLEIKIGAQKVYALMDEKFPTPIKLDMLIQNVVLSDQKTFDFKIGELAAKSDLTEDSPNVWSGPTSYGIKNLDLSVKGENSFHMQLGSMGALAKVKGMNLAIMQSYQERMKELGDAGLDFEKGMSPQAFSAFWKTIMEYGMQQATSGEFQVDLANLIIEGTEKGEDGKPVQHTFGIGQIGYGGSFDGSKTDDGSLGLRFALKDVVAQDGGGSDKKIPAELIPYIPHSFAFNVNFKHVPFQKLMQQFGSLAEQAVAADQKGTPPGLGDQTKMMQAAMSLPVILGEAGTIATVSETSVRNDRYNLSVDGDYTASAQAVYGGSGRANITFAGLDQLVTDLGTLVNNPATNPAVLYQVGQAYQGLTAMQMFGQQGKSADGKQARIYNFSVDAQGNILLNGAPLAALMDAPGPSAGQAAGSAPLPPAR